MPPVGRTLCSSHRRSFPTWCVSADSPKIALTPHGLAICSGRCRRSVPAGGSWPRPGAYLPRRWSRASTTWGIVTGYVVNGACSSSRSLVNAPRATRIPKNRSSGYSDAGSLAAISGSDLRATAVVMRLARLRVRLQLFTLARELWRKSLLLPWPKCLPGASVGEWAAPLSTAWTGRTYCRLFTVG